MFFLQLLPMDVSARATMKDAAKCDKRCEWQNSANQKNAERILHSLVTPKSMSGSGRLHIHAVECEVVPQHRLLAFLCVNDIVTVL